MDEVELPPDFIKDCIRFHVQVDMPSDLMEGMENKIGFKYLMHKMVLEESYLTKESLLKNQLDIMVREVVREIARRLRA